MLDRIRTTRMKVLSSRALIATGILLAVILGVMLLLKTVLVLTMPEKQLKRSVSLFFKDNFDKAVEFEDIRLTMAGNLVVSNLNISASSDFNDNITLIKSKRAKIGLRLFSLLRKKLMVTDLYFDDPEITIAKKFGESYRDFITALFLAGKPLNKVRFVDFRDFRISFRDGKLTYIEGFRDSRVLVGCSGVDTDIVFKDKNLAYSAKGVLEPYRSRGIGRGDFDVSGELRLENLDRVVSSNNIIKIENLDISHGNAFLKEHVAGPYSIAGGISLNLSLATFMNNLSVAGSIELNDFNLETRNNGGSYRIVSNENLDMDIIADVLNGGARIVFKKLEIDDDRIRISADGALCTAENDKTLDIAFMTEKINLAKVSDYFTPGNNLAYEGYLSASGRCRYVYGGNRMGNVVLDLDLADFSLIRKEKGRRISIVDDIDLSVALSNDTLNMTLAASRSAEDIVLRCRSYIHQWVPFRSRSSIEVHSKRINLDTAWNAAAKGIESLIQGAYEDQSKGYDDLIFGQKPSGFFFGNNDIDLQCRADSIAVGKNRGWHDLVLVGRLNDGYLRLQEFSLSGFDGEYELDVSGYFNSDHPNFSAKGKFRNINLEKLAKGYGCAGDIQGTLSAEFEYDVNGYKLSHFLENGKSTVSLAIEAGYLRGSTVQERLKNYMAASGYGNTRLLDISLSRASLAFRQQGENFYLDSIVFSGDNLSFNAYGSYSFFDGLRIPLNAVVNVETMEGNPVKTINVPCLIKGRLLDPALMITTRKDAAEMLLFHVN